jgi:hypothetical protein
VSTQESTPGPTVFDNRMAGQRPEPWGNRLRAERPVYKEGPTPRRERGAITVRVTFEAHRLATTYLATAYEQIVPLRQRGLRAKTGAAPDHTGAGAVERAGA